MQNLFKMINEMLTFFKKKYFLPLERVQNSYFLFESFSKRKVENKQSDLQNGKKCHQGREVIAKNIQVHSVYFSVVSSQMLRPLPSFTTFVFGAILRFFSLLDLVLELINVDHYYSVHHLLSFKTMVFLWIKSNFLNFLRLPELFRKIAIFYHEYTKAITKSCSNGHFNDSLGKQKIYNLKLISQVDVH